jgi:hypothetical protein
MTHTVALPSVLWVLLLSLCACATAQVAYDKPGITQAERQQDVSECLRAAISTDERVRLFTLYQIDREAYGRCLEARGYTSRRG